MAFAWLVAFALALVACVSAQQVLPPTTPSAPNGPDGVFENPYQLPKARLVPPPFNPCASNATAVVANSTAAGSCKPPTGADVGFNYLAQSGTNYPEQVQVTAAGPDLHHYYIKFQTPRAAGTRGFLLWDYSSDFKAPVGVRCNESYYEVFPEDDSLFYKSGSIYYCLVGKVQANVVVYYKIVTPAGNNKVYSFKTAPTPGSTGKMKLALIADAGQTVNASSTFDNVIAGKPDFVLWAGDLTYADDYGGYGNATCVAFNGTEYTPVPGSSSPPAGQPQICGVGGYKWDSWGRLVEKMVAYYPTAYVPGNHELEIVGRANSYTPFIAYQARIPGFAFGSSYQPSLGYSAPPLAPRYYSLNIGMVHVLGLSTYEAFTQYTSQWLFVTTDLTLINKNVTPWFIGMSHTPWYNTDNSHYEEGEPIRGQYETLFYNAGMDLHQFGHVHAYERSWPVYQFRIDPCGPVHVTVGDGGTIEAVAGPFLVDSVTGNFAYYSAARDYYFGHSEVTFYNATTAIYTWYRNYAGNAVAYDSFALTSKKALGCPKVKGS